MNDMFGNPVPVEAAPPDPINRLTPALRRVMEKAIEAGVIRRAGIYSDAPQSAVADEPQFDWQHSIDRCIAAGWMAPGVAFNTYAPTSAGHEAIAADDRRIAGEIRARMEARAARAAERAAQKAVGGRKRAA